jgi:hypothetical protein
MAPRAGVFTILIEEAEEFMARNKHPIIFPLKFWPIQRIGENHFLSFLESQGGVTISYQRC